MRYFAWFLLLLWSCGGNGGKEDNTVRFRQYYVQGQQLYEQHCSNCHQADGQGFAKLYPPLAQSDYMLADMGHTVCLIKYGMEGEIIVNEKKYNQPMPANTQLTNIEIAEIATYISNAWGNQHGLISVKEVNTLLKQCAASTDNK